MIPAMIDMKTYNETKMFTLTDLTLEYSSSTENLVEMKVKLKRKIKGERES